jgi:transcriptional regulator with XRE-family HTH domain
MADSFTSEIKEIEFDLIEGLRVEREARGLTREEVSLKLGASENLISKLESHKRGLEAALIVKLAKIYDLTEGTLIRRAKTHAKKLRALRQTSKDVKL